MARTVGLPPEVLGGSVPFFHELRELSVNCILHGGKRRGACLMGAAEPVSIVCSIKWVRPSSPSPVVLLFL